MSIIHALNSTNPKLPSITKEEHFSDEVVTGQIYTKHRESVHKIKIDVKRYITLVECIITTADRMSHYTRYRYQGTEGGLIFSDDFLKVKATDPPLCVLHQISSKLACKAPGIETAHQTTMDILDILINYPWEAKAILTFTAFATEYGAIWHLKHYSLFDPLAKSLAIIKRIPFLKRHLNSIKYQQVLFGPRSLIYSCLRAIEYINELQNFAKYDIKEPSELSSSILQIPLVTYWIIHIIVASRIEISCYLNDTEGQSQKYLNELAEKIDSILNLLEEHLNILREGQLSIKNEDGTKYIPKGQLSHSTPLLLPLVLGDKKT